MSGVYGYHCGGLTDFGQTRPHAVSFLRTNNRLPSANSVKSWARFWARPAVAGIHMAEPALDHPERMRDPDPGPGPGPDPGHGDDAVDPLVEGMQLAALGGLAQFKCQASDPGDRL